MLDKYLCHLNNFDMPSDITKYNFFNNLKNQDFIDEIWLFGSRADNTNQERSDIDIAILCPRAKKGDWLKIVDIIDDADTLLKIDCIRYDNLPENKLKSNICNNKIIIFKRYSILTL